jgi:hypothetical protein
MQMYTKIQRCKRFILLLLLIHAPVIALYAQQFSCGSEPSAQLLQYFRNRQELNSNAKLASGITPSKLGTLKTLSITAWIVKDSLRNPGMSPTQIDAAIVITNIDFAPMNLAFKVCAVKYIENFQYDSLVTKLPPTDKEQQLYVQYHDSSTINMYFVTKINRGGGFPAGYAYAPGGKDLVMIRKGSVSDGKTISHELGHYFGLLHTFEIATGAELVNRKSPCSQTGDMLCDTEADPYPKGTELNCEFVSGDKDASGEFYTPPIGNIMAYYSNLCKCGFTQGQFAIMTDIYLTKRSYLY